MTVTVTVTAVAVLVPVAVLVAVALRLLGRLPTSVTTIEPILAPGIPAHEVFVS